jgi:hypothetical protein
VEEGGGLQRERERRGKSGEGTTQKVFLFLFAFQVAHTWAHGSILPKPKQFSPVASISGFVSFFFIVNIPVEER